MIGAICRQDIVFHPVITIRCFGWRVLFKALLAGQHQTFLSLLTETPVLRMPPVKVPELVERCIGLELRAARVYESLARRFGQTDPVQVFFATLASQERDHAELLGLCRAAARRGEWNAKHFDPWRDAVPALEEQLKEAESRAESLDRLSDALQLVIELEASEINQLYSGIVAASESDFVRTLRVFCDAGREHISYISRSIPEMDPALRDVCRNLRDEYSRALPRA
jgi:rubrerythrin